MTGIELARAYWEVYGIPMIREQFPEYEEMSRGAYGQRIGMLRV